jgi:hypothetical protein
MGLISICFSKIGLGGTFAYIEGVIGFGGSFYELSFGDFAFFPSNIHDLEAKNRSIHFTRQPI